MRAIVCVTVKFSRVFLHEYNDGKWKNFKDATAFQIFVCISNRLVLRKKKTQLYCELLENITFCVSFTLTFRIN